MSKTKAEILTRRSQLSPTKQALLAQRLQGKIAPTPETIPPRSHTQNIPLSFAQQRLWFLHEFDPDNAFYNEPIAVKLQGSVNITALEQSLDRIVSRHQALRTNFSTVDGQPIQIIRPSLTILVAVTNLQELSASEQQNAIAQIVISETHQPFDLTEDPLLRVRLLQLNETENVLLLVAHHIVFDGWSLGVLVRELAEFYKSFSRNIPLSLPELPIQYADFAIWQRQWLQGEVFDRQLAYWQEQLQDLPILELPTDKPRSPVQNFCGAKYFFNLSLELSESLKNLSQQTDTTSFMTLLAAFQVLLHRYAAQDEIVVGTVIANRNRPEIEPAIGVFVNTLVLRTYLGDNPTFRQLLARVKEVTLEAYAHQDLPFEKLVEALNPERNLSRSPLFEVMFALNNAPLPPLELDGLQMTPLDIDPGIAKFDLDLSLTETEAGLAAAVEYDTDLFSAQTIARMMSHWQTLLASIVSNPEQHIADLPLLTDVERQWLLVEWSGREGDGEMGRWGDGEMGREGDGEMGRWGDGENYSCIHQLFEAQVEKTPNAIAVVLEEEHLTYQELNERANHLAHYLQQLGVKPEVLVGICVERSLDMVVGILAILKAGGAYVPLDPSYPQERLAFMLADSQAPVLLTQSHLVTTLPKHNAQVVCLDTEDVGAQCNSPGGHGFASAPLPTQNPTNLAYVIYTSGSTGQPKGVMVEHRSLVDAYLAWEKAYQLRSLHTHLQMANFSFDVFAGDLVRALCSGGKLVLCPRDFLLSPRELYDLMRREGVDCAEFVPVVLRHLIQYLADTGQNLDFMRLLACGSDSWYVREYQKFQQFCGADTRLINSFGVTEATIDSAYFESPLLELAAEQLVPIGRPFTNTEIYILDARSQLVPIGVFGELYIGGVGVARGYRDRPELTAANFIPHPFSAEAGARLYRTGDLARWLPDGNIEFRGRVDYQAKIRGYRIELGEIEAFIQEYPAVKEVAALVREDTPGEKHLVAYIAPNLNLADLRVFLTEKLPSQMMPSSFVFLDSLPLTPNGKIDRRALPIPDRLELPGSFAPPRNSIEAALSEIWSEVLNLPQVGISDNFFELGGDSILTIAVISKADRQGLRLTPKQLFQYQTIAELALVVDTAPEIVAEQGVVTGDVPLTPIQHWFFAEQFQEMHHWNQSLWLSVKPGTNSQLLETAIASLLTHHDALRMRFVQTGDCWQQICLKPDGSVPHFKYDLSHLSSSEQKLEIQRLEAELQASFNLESGCLWRSAFFDCGSHSRLLIIVHHLVIDGVSWRVLLEDLQTAYEQLSQNRALAQPVVEQRIALPPKTTSFKQWAEKLAVYAQSAELMRNPVTMNYFAGPHPASGSPLPSLGEGLGVRAEFDLNSERDFWFQEQPGNDLPVDFPGGSNTVADNQTIEVKLSSRETKALLQQVPAAYRTQIDDVLLTALVQAFAEWTGEPALLLDLEGHGREEIFPDVDVSRTVGWFTTVFPVFLDLGEIEITAARKALQTIKEQLRGIPNRGFNYGVLRYLSQNLANEYLLRRRCANAATQTKSACADFKNENKATVSFNYLGQFDQSFTRSSLFELDEDSPSLPCSPLGNRSYVLEIDSHISEGQLKTSWTYSQTLQRHETIENLAQSFIEKLRSLIAHCQSPDAGGYTPSDFPLVRFTQAQLDTTFKNIEDAYPLSPMQQGMLFHTLLAPESGVYVDVLRFDLRGVFDVAAFMKAWELAIERHPVLRTAFVWKDLEKPLQVVLPQVQFPWQEYDWRELTLEERTEQLEDLLQTDEKQGFELSQAPLMRFHLIRQAEDSYHFIWTAHHLLLDGWSLPLIFQEVVAYYQDANLSLPPSPPYRNYIAWLQQQDLSKAEAFWREKLKGFTAPIRLWVDKHRRSRSYQVGSYAQQQIYLSSATTAALNSLAKQQHFTPNILMQGVWAILLSRYSRESDVVFGTVVSGRPYTLKNVDSMVGNFINTLPARIQVEPEAFLLSWLQQLQQQQLEAQHYEYSPLSEVQKWSDIPQGVSLFENIFVFENYPSDFSLQQRVANLEIERAEGFDRTNYPLELTVEVGAEYSVTLAYDRERFDSDAIERMLGHFQTLLESIISNPQQRLQDLSILTDAERQQLLEVRSQKSGVRSRGTMHCAPKEGCIHQLFEEQVEKTPNAIAVIFGEQKLTYQELDRKANHLACYLQQLGVKPEVLVGICVERSLDMVVGILGILKAGGAYVPLDPTYPQERLAFMLADSQAPVLVTQSHLLPNLPEHHAQVVCLDSDWKSSPHPALSGTPLPSLGEGKASQVADFNSQALAYVIYTSGSTGTPKGVMVQHQSLVNFTQTAIEEYEITQSDRILQFASISFDAAAEEIYPCLAAGATLVLRTDEMLGSARKFVRACQDWALTVLDLPTAYWHQLTADLATAELQLPPSLRLTIIGGEQAPSESVENWRKCANNCSLINTYGPTEATVVSTSYRLPESGSTLNIGNSISGVQTYILDPFLQPVPIGIPGELYIGGTNLARGYLHRPELTDDRFISNPFSKELGARMYRSGDLVRYLADGNIEFLGRLDRQVKIRGFRVETSEIEAVLSQYPGVKASLVLLREDEPGNRQLVAYLVTQPELELSTSDLRNFFKQKLPSYMVPAAVIRLDNFPLTPNGKIDLKALPQQSDSRPELEVNYVIPQTEAEKIIATVWQQYLKVDRIGIHDSFFDLGGNSLLMIKVNSQLQEKFNTEISLIEMFRYPTIDSLARHLDRTSKSTPIDNISIANIRHSKNRQKERLAKMQQIGKINQ
ncbi:MAG: amino acid adenylation domain-containing protein [Cyanosarcina radialis HA8281-LM2]|jgi:amino acid adenylation domain-containing protein/non-ribosomal peptide synthase protein (TIGR01720 family)|nr:amino acid adenylation domain-containing protein [Cyanosarcina radialis HA8281-LM2]